MVDRNVYDRYCDYLRASEVFEVLIFARHFVQTSVLIVPFTTTTTYCM